MFDSFIYGIYAEKSLRSVRTYMYKQMDAVMDALDNSGDLAKCYHATRTG